MPYIATDRLCLFATTIPSEIKTSARSSRSCRETLGIGGAAAVRLKFSVTSASVATTTVVSEGS